MTKFDLGKITISESIKEKLGEETIQAALKRHADGDWGYAPKMNALQNEQTAREGGPGVILSEYSDSNNLEFWVVTDTMLQETSVFIPEKE